LLRSFAPQLTRQSQKSIPSIFYTICAGHLINGLAACNSFIQASVADLALPILSGVGVAIEEEGVPGNATGIEGGVPANGNAGEASALPLSPFA
jgi:hypothetical protein